MGLLVVEVYELWLVGRRDCSRTRRSKAAPQARCGPAWGSSGRPAAVRMAKFSSCQNTSEKINHFVRDGCVGRAAAGCLSETGSHFAFDAKKEFRVQFGWLPIRLKNTLSSMAKARRQPAVKKPAAKADETRAALRC